MYNHYEEDDDYAGSGGFSANHDYVSAEYTFTDDDDDWYYMCDNEYVNGCDSEHEEDADNKIPFYKSKLDPAFDPFDLYAFDDINGGDCLTRNNRYSKISHVIGEDYKDWYRDASFAIPVFITAQTGKGKNHFVNNCLLRDYLQKEYHAGIQNLLPNSPFEYRFKALIVSNRLALSVQMKTDLLESLNLLYLVKGLSDEDIINRYSFDFVTIITYQSLPFVIDELVGDYSHIVFDECHFFTSDAMFNPNTGFILRTIMGKLANRYPCAVRIYMSATMGDCLKYIGDGELRLAGWDRKMDRKVFMVLNRFAFKRYDLPRDYSFLKIKYFSEHKQLIDIIKGSGDDKWLIFIDDKSRCLELQKELTDNNISIIMAGERKESNAEIMVTSADSKKDKGYISMLKDGKMPEDIKVLISTSVIDNGVSIGNKNLKHVVIEEMDKVKCLQFVGRKRVKDEWFKEGYTFTLYIKIVTEYDVQRKIDSLNSQMEAYSAYENAHYECPDTLSLQQDPKYERERRLFNQRYYNGNLFDFKNAKHWFYRDSKNPEFVRTNKIARDFIYLLLKRYHSILKEMREPGRKLSYLEYQLSWFEQSDDCVYKPENNIDLHFQETERKAFNQYVDKLRIQKVIPIETKEKKKAFMKEFFTKHYGAYGFRYEKDGYGADDNKSEVKKNGYGITIINDIFKTRKINLKIRSEVNKQSRKIDKWVVFKHEWPVEESKTPLNQIIEEYQQCK